MLIYDDDLEILRISKLILADEYQHVETCLSCENLFEDIERVKPDIILMDLWMPHLGGEHAIELLRMNDKTRDIPVVIFSAINEIEKVSNRVKASAIIKKPFSIDELRQTVRKFIS